VRSIKNKLNHELPVMIEIPLKSLYFFLLFDIFIVHGNS